jgi:rod shape-determining protein MreB
MGIPTYIAEDPISCVAKGTGMSLEYIDVLEKSMMSSNKIK